MKTKLICLLTIVTMVCTGCTFMDYNLPVYEMTSDTNGLCVNIDGAIYSEKPAIKWYIQLGEKAIGYTKSRDMKVYEALGDTERNFIYLMDISQPFYADKPIKLLYRTDKTIPEPSEGIVNKIQYCEDDFRGKEKGNTLIL